MSALTAPRIGLSNKGPIILDYGYGVAANQVIYNGAQVAKNASGFLVPAATTAGLRVVGVADLENHPKLDTTGLADGAVKITVRLGIFNMKFGATTDAVTAADEGNDVYVLDDQTISRVPGAGRPIAGQLFEVNGTDAFVGYGIGVPNRRSGQGTAWQGPGSSDTIAAAGAISVNTEVTAAAVTGTTAYTLADGLFLGQRKTVTASTPGSSPVGTITPATRGGGYANVTAFGTLGDSVEFIWANPTSPAWYIASSQGVTIA